MRAKFINESTDSEDLLLQYEKALTQHDWYYEMSDDNRWYERGLREKKNISNLIKQLADAGEIKKAEEIWKKIAPKSPSGNQYAFPGVPKPLGARKPVENKPKYQKNYKVGDRVLVDLYGGAMDKVEGEITDVLDDEFNQALNTYYGVYKIKIDKGWSEFGKRYVGKEETVKDFQIKEKR